MAQTFQNDQVGIANVPDIRIAVLEHRGDPALIAESVRRFIEWRKAAGLPHGTSATFNIFYNDPHTTPPDEFRLDIGAGTDRDVPANAAGIVTKIIPGGRCAVLRHVGRPEDLGQALTFLYASWLPQSGAELRDFPPYCQRVAFFPFVPEHEAIIDLFVPLK
jgi:AraC family transcriptional regulator